MTTYHYPMYDRLEPRTEFRGGRLTDTDVLSLEEAAFMASKHSGVAVTVGDFLRAGARGEITLRAIIHRTAKLELIGGGVYCNAGTPNENTAREGAILNLPLTACQHLANVGRARWRTLDGFKEIEGELCRYDRVQLLETEPDFETVPADCRVTGYHVHALADEFYDEPPTPPAPALVKSELVPEYTGSNGKVLYEVSLDELMDIKAARTMIEARAAAWAMQAAEDEEEVFAAIARQRDGNSPPAPPGQPDRVTESETWQVYEPQRFGGYASPLYRLLNNARLAGQPCPKARDVLEEWRTKTPTEVAKVLTDSIDYYDSKGNTKTANLAAIKEAITRMTRAR